MAGRRDAATELQVQRRHCSPGAAPPTLAGAALLALLCLAGPAPAADDGRSPLGDLLHVVVTPRALLAVDGEGGGETREDLELGEQVLWTGSRGAVGMALTDRRVLAVRAESGAWQTTRWRRGESRPAAAELGDRVALLATDRRLLGFDGGSGNLAETSVGPNEEVLATSVAANVAVVVTSRRALGLSPFVGGFFETPLRVGETVESVDAGSEIVTLTTSHRLLFFRARGGYWSERRLELQ
jgi:hypothetical protein